MWGSPALDEGFVDIYASLYVEVAIEGSSTNIDRFLIGWG